MTPYVSYTRRNNNATQRFTLYKCTFSNTSYAIRDGYVSQRSAIIKCPIPNVGNTIRNNNTGQRRAVMKSPLPNTINTFRKNNISQRTAIIKCLITYYPYTLFNGISTIKFIRGFQQFSSIFAIFHIKFIRNGLI